MLKSAKDIADRGLEYSIVLRERLADLRQQMKEIEKSIAEFESSLDVVVRATKDAIAMLLDGFGDKSLMECKSMLDDLENKLNKEKEIIDPNMDTMEPRRKKSRHGDIVVLPSTSNDDKQPPTLAENTSEQQEVGAADSPEKSDRSANGVIGKQKDNNFDSTGNLSNLKETTASATASEENSIQACIGAKDTSPVANSVAEMETAEKDKIDPAPDEASNEFTPNHDSAIPGRMSHPEQDDLSEVGVDGATLPVTISAEASTSTTAPVSRDVVNNYRVCYTVDRMHIMDKMEKELRSTKVSVGTKDTHLLYHLHNNHTEDNLYFVCVRTSDWDQETVQLVQADRYTAENSDPSTRAQNISLVEKGQWRCTYLVPYYKDYNEVIEKVRWRYQIKGIGKTSKKGYWSFDDYKRRGSGENVLVDHSQLICLFPYPEGNFLYGPFSWAKNRDDLFVEKKLWVHAMPSILRAGTTSGPLFGHGFSQSLLMTAAKTWDKQPLLKISNIINLRNIQEARKNEPVKECLVIPLEYASLSPQRRKQIERRVPYREFQKVCSSSFGSFLYEEVDGVDPPTGKPKKESVKVAVYVKKETPNRKKLEETNSYKQDNW